jgi:hypothetical protein
MVVTNLGIFDVVGVVGAAPHQEGGVKQRLGEMHAQVPEALERLPSQVTSGLQDHTEAVALSTVPGWRLGRNILEGFLITDGSCNFFYNKRNLRKVLFS